MKLGGSAIVMGGAWLVLSACSGKYDMGSEAMAGSGGSATPAASGGKTASGGTGDSAGSSVSLPGSSGSGGSMSAGPSEPAPGPDSRCGFSPIAQGDVTPSATSEEVAARVYGFLEGAAAPDVARPALPTAAWSARLAKSILDSHFKAGTSVPGLERFLHDFIDPASDTAPLMTPAAWAVKLADPQATLATLLSEPTGEPHRFGILTEPEVLAQHPGITPRGVWMIEALFCQVVPAPPPNIPSLPAPEDGLSKRESLARQVVNPACAACHTITDPPAFALENFDEAGNYRVLDNGVPVDASGRLAEFASSGSPAVMSFNSFDDLAPQLANSCNVAHCFSSTLSDLAALRAGKVAFSEAEANQIANSFADSGFSVRALVEAIVTNRAFLR